MFETLRKMIVPIIVVVLVLFVALIVLEWGLESSGRSSGMVGQPDAGSINGEKISWTMYQQVVSNLTRTESEKSGGDLSKSQMAQLEQQAWNQIVQEKIFTQEAERRGIVVTENDVYNYLKYNPPTYLQSSPSFQTNGQFDYQKYLQAMVSPDAASFWAQIEQVVRPEIRQFKVQQAIVGTVNVSDLEVRQAYLDTLEMVRVGIISVPYSRFTSAMPQHTEEAVNAHYAANKEKYRMEDRASVNLVMVSSDPSETDWQTAAGRAKRISDTLKTGADFAELARIYSDDASAQNGGELGFYGRGATVAEFDSAIFAMDSGQVSIPIKTQFGYHIIKHSGFRTTPVEGAEPQKEANVAHILFRATISDATREERQNKLREIASSGKGGNLKAAAEAAGLSLVKTPFFFKNQNIPQIGYHLQANQFAFSAKLAEISDVMDSDIGSFLIQVDERKNAGVADIEEVRGRVIQELNLEYAAKQTGDTAKAIWSLIQAGTTWDEAAKRYRAEYKELNAFSRSMFLPELGRDPKAIGAAFSLTNVGQSTGVVEYSNGSAIMRLLERIQPDLATYNDKRDSILTQVRFAKQREVLNRWYDAQQKSAKIVNNTGEVAGTI